MSVCKWRDMQEYWETGCDNAFSFETEGPEENGFKFCPYCGKTIKKKVKR